MNRTTSIHAPRLRGNPPAVEPRSTAHQRANRRWQAEVETRRRLVALACGLCPACETPQEDTALVWHPGCAPERGM